MIYYPIQYLWVPKSMLRYQLIACMTAMLLDHRLDSATIVYISMRIALQSYNKIDGIVT